MKCILAALQSLVNVLDFIFFYLRFKFVDMFPIKRCYQCVFETSKVSASSAHLRKISSLFYNKSIIWFFKNMNKGS